MRRCVGPKHTRCEGTAAADPRPLGDRERPARRAGRDGSREDASRIRRGSATQVMAIVRNIVIFVFNQRGYRSVEALHASLRLPPQTLEILSRPI